MRSKSIIALAFVFLLNLTIQAGSVFGQSFAGGTGTAQDPYQISTPDHLNNVRNKLSSHFIIVNDIDMNVAPYNTGAGWVPIINNFNDRFTGSFNGQNFTISNLFISRDGTDYVGVFGYLTGNGGEEIKNLTLANVNITGKNFVGALSGLISTIRIINVHSSGSINTNAYSGGLVGSSNSGAPVRESSSSASVNGLTYVGGLVGFASARISNSFSSGTVIGNSRSGGLVGTLRDTVYQSYSKSTVRPVDLNSSNTTNLGGLVGESEGGKVIESFAAGSVSGFIYIGGLVGNSESNSLISNSYSVAEVTGGQIVGGLAGGVSSAEIINSYSGARVNLSSSSTSREGGVIGLIEGTSTIASVIWSPKLALQDKGVGSGDGSNVVSLTGSQFKQSANFSGWDFSNTWAILADSTFPYLRNNVQDTLPGSLVSTTDILGSIATNTTLTAANSPHVFSGNTTIASGVTLTVEAGARLQLQENVILDVQGNLVLNGSENSRISITKNDQNKFKRIIISPNGSLTANYTNWSQGDTLLALAGGVATISNSAFTDASVGILNAEHSQQAVASLDSVKIARNTVGFLQQNQNITLNNILLRDNTTGFQILHNTRTSAGDFTFSGLHFVSNGIGLSSPYYNTVSNATVSQYTFDNLKLENNTTHYLANHRQWIYITIQNSSFSGGTYGVRDAQDQRAEGIIKIDNNTFTNTEYPINEYVSLGTSLSSTVSGNTFSGYKTAVRTGYDHRGNISTNSFTGGTIGIEVGGNSQRQLYQWRGDISSNTFAQHDTVFVERGVDDLISTSASPFYLMAIEGNSIKSQNGVGIALKRLFYTATGNLFDGNNVAIEVTSEVGDDLSSFTQSIIANSFINNGVGVRTNVGSNANGTYRFTGNDFLNSTNFHVQLTAGAAGNLDFSDSYWGTQQISEIEAKIFDSNDDNTIFGSVNFSLFRSELSPFTVTLNPQVTRLSGDRFTINWTQAEKADRYELSYTRSSAPAADTATYTLPVEIAPSESSYTLTALPGSVTFAMQAVNGVGSKSPQERTSAIVSDSTKPVLVDANGIGGQTRITITASKDLAESVLSANQWSVSPSISINNIARVSGSQNRLNITLSSALQPGIEYTLTASSLTDGLGNSRTSSFVFTPVNPSSSISGLINDRRIFTAEASPYLITGTTQITSNGELVVEPGAEIRIAEGANLIVDGILSMIGTADSVIRLRGNGLLKYNMVHVRSGATLTSRYSWWSGADSLLVMEGGAVTVTNSRFTDASVGIVNAENEGSAVASFDSVKIARTNTGWWQQNQKANLSRVEFTNNQIGMLLKHAVRTKEEQHVFSGLRFTGNIDGIQSQTPVNSNSGGVVAIAQYTIEDSWFDGNTKAIAFPSHDGLIRVYIVNNSFTNNTYGVEGRASSNELDIINNHFENTEYPFYNSNFMGYSPNSEIKGNTFTGYKEALNFGLDSQYIIESNSFNGGNESVSAIAIRGEAQFGTEEYRINSAYLSISENTFRHHPTTIVVPNPESTVLWGTSANRYRVDITDNIFSGEGGVGIALDRLFYEAEGNVFTGHSKGIVLPSDLGTLSNTQETITNTNFTQSVKGNTFFANDVGLSTNVGSNSSATYDFTNNDFISSTNFHVELYEGANEVLDFTNTYWGTDQATEIAAKIFDSNDDSNISGTINFNSFRTEETPFVVTLNPKVTRLAGNQFRLNWTTAPLASKYELSYTSSSSPSADTATYTTPIQLDSTLASYEITVPQGNITFAMQAISFIGTASPKELTATRIANTTKPSIISVNALAGSTQIDVQFSTPLSESVLNVASWNIVPSIPITNIVFSGSLNDNISITVGEALVRTTQLTLYNASVTDTLLNSDSLGVSFFPEDGNANPTISLSELDLEREYSQVELTFTITDEESDLVSVISEYSIDQGSTWLNPTIVNPDTSRLDAQNYVKTLVWNTVADLPALDLSNVWFRVRPYDNSLLDIGAEAVIRGIKIDNNDAPVLAYNGFTAQQRPQTEAYFGDISLSVVVSDTEGDSLGWSARVREIDSPIWTTISGIAFENNLRDGNFSGNVSWNFTSDLPDSAATFVFEVVVFDTDTVDVSLVDTLLYDGIGVSRTFAAELNPSTQQEPKGNIISIEYTLVNAVQNPASVKLQILLNGEWKDATVTQSPQKLATEEIQNTSTLLWNSTADLPASFIGQVKLRVMPINNDGKFGIAESFDLFVRNNEQPEISVTIASDEITESFTFDISVSDTEQDDVIVTSEYSQDGGQTFIQSSSMGFLESDLTYANPIQLETQLQGESRTFGWKTDEDVPLFEGTVILRLLMQEVGTTIPLDTLVYELLIDNIADMPVILGVETSGNQSILHFGGEIVFQLSRPLIEDSLKTFDILNEANDVVDVAEFVSSYEETGNQFYRFATSNPLPTGSVFSLNISSSSMIDERGVPLDGSGNDDVDGSPTDDVQFEFSTSLLADINTDSLVTVADVSEFINIWNGWKSDASLLSYEMGPVVGQYPYFTVVPDDKFDVEDFSGFVSTWNYAREANLLNSELGQEIFSSIQNEENAVAETVSSASFEDQQEGESDSRSEMMDLTSLREDIREQGESHWFESIPELFGYNKKEVETIDPYISLQIPKKERVYQNAQSSYLADSTTTIHVMGWYTDTLNVMEVVVKYDIETMEIANIENKQFFGAEAGETLFMSYSDTLNGLFVMNVGNLSKKHYSLEPDTLATITFSHKEETTTDIWTGYTLIDNQGTTEQYVTNEKVDTRKDLPEEIALLTNYPNPFNPSTTMRYHIAEDARVSLMVYDVLGRQVATLVDRKQAPGFYQQVWDASRMASGVYLYVMVAQTETGGFVRHVKKMTLIK